MKNVDRAYWAANVAIAGISWWVLTATVLHLLTAADYEPVRQTISEMAHERYGVFLDIAFFPLGIAGLALALGLRWTLKDAVVAPVLLAITAGLWIVLGVFRTGPNGTEAIIHDTAAIISFVLILIVMLVCSLQFRGDSNWGQYAQPTLICALGLIVNIALFPLFGEDGLGLAQRFYVAVWMIWLFGAAVRLRRMTSAIMKPA